jgi:hypothetical protein
MSVALALAGSLAVLVVFAWLTAKAIRRAEPELDELHRSVGEFKAAIMNEVGKLAIWRRKA